MTEAAVGKPMVVFDDVSKTFRLPRVNHSTLKSRLLNPFARARYDELLALQNVSFEVREGEFFGVIGRNGSGKSTLLKVLAGIYLPTSGTVQLGGSLAPFIELGVGFNMELSARDNVFINGALLGLSRSQLRERYDRIVEFAELDRFMGMKLRNFSSGMQVRLAFSIAIESGSEVLLIDEVLAVGDERFQRKCYEVFDQRRQAGQTVIFVSHDMAAVEAFCDRVLLLESGAVVDVGDASRMTSSYHQLNLERAAHSAEAIDLSADASPVEAWVETGESRSTVVRQGAAARLVVRVHVNRPHRARHLDLQATVADRFRNPVFKPCLGLESLPDEAGSVRCIFDLPNVLVPGSYWISATVRDPVSQDPIADADDIAEFEVQPASDVSLVGHERSGGTIEAERHPAEAPSEIEV